MDIIPLLDWNQNCYRSRFKLKAVYHHIHMINRYLTTLVIEFIKIPSNKSWISKSNWKNELNLALRNSVMIEVMPWKKNTKHTPKFKYERKTQNILQLWAKSKQKATLIVGNISTSTLYISQNEDEHLRGHCLRH